MNQTIHTICSHCGKNFRVAPKHINKRTKCSRCGETFTVTESAAVNTPQSDPPGTSPHLPHKTDPTKQPASLWTDAATPSHNAFASPQTDPVRHTNLNSNYDTVQPVDIAGILSIILGSFGLASIVFGCMFSCIGGFIVFPISALLGITGLVAAFFAKTNLRIGGFILNIFVLVFISIMLITVAASLISGSSNNSKKRTRTGPPNKLWSPKNESASEVPQGNGPTSTTDGSKAQPTPAESTFEEDTIAPTESTKEDATAPQTDPPKNPFEEGSQAPAKPATESAAAQPSCPPTNPFVESAEGPANPTTESPETQPNEHPKNPFEECVSATQ